MYTRSLSILGVALALSFLGGCATPIQTVSPRAVAPATGNITATVYTQADLNPHPINEGALQVLGRTPELGGLLHERGYNVANRSSNWTNTAIIDSFGVMVDSPTYGVHYITYALQDKFADIKVPPATSTAIRGHLGDLYKEPGGSGVLDADASTYGNGAAMTGSAGGGIVVGLAVGAAQTLAHSVASHNEKPKRAEPAITLPPMNTAILVGRVQQTVGTLIGTPQVQRVILVVSSDKEESPAVLLDVALRKYADVYQFGAKAHLISKSEAAAVGKDSGQK